MISSQTNRRRFLTGLAAGAATLATPTLASARPRLHVLKDENCGCCVAWARIMQDNGFDVSVQNVTYDRLGRYKLDNGIPENMMSCHTALVEGYLIEGHVPAADVHRLLSEQPDAIGLSVPEMPYGSPGMGPEDEREAYNVYLMRKDGTAEVFAAYEAA